MASELNIGVYVDPESSSRIKLNCVNLNTKVDTMKVMISDKANLQKDLIDLVYCGCILEDDSTLESYGLKNGSIVHVLKKKIEKPKTQSTPVPEATILQLAATFKSFSNNASLRSALHRLSKRPESLENIILSTQGLYDDAVAMAMLQDPDLMAHFTDPNTVRKIAEHHPVLLEAAQMIAAVVHLDARNAATAPGPGPSSMNAPPTTYPYGLENLSEDEDMTGDSSQSSDSPVTNGATYSSSMITTSQLARALSRAGTRSSGSNQSSSSTSSTAATAAPSNTGNSNSAGINPSSGTGLITPEMFSQAIQQAFAAGGARTSSGAPIILPQAADFQRQLTQMHEIGLMDDVANVQALQFTNGDVQAAIELVFSGFRDNI
ncbi:hypothetical protein HCN44_010535 [Aphidius gifuensis]|uniref:Ubiquitin-like protein n=1 Tax=Aphidius gifuensis TaxID=684658 RepID=A0A834XV11_APHGI|nr:ubiquitin-like protein 7 [Aphidius gifuensis]KAF7991734.1 hypothetical protein HCN44_010535 [Aphidius gifuensis]